MSDNYFTELSTVDCSLHTEKKGKFTYLSWTYAVQELKKRHPNASWEVCRFDGMPFLNTEFGVFVEVAVTVGNVTHSQIHPVLDNRNQPVVKPSSFQINTSIQRCLVKAIALHGLGLYIYSGEDLPEQGTITKDQGALISKGIIEKNIEPDVFYKAYNIKQVLDLPAESFDGAMSRIEQTKGKES